MFYGAQSRVVLLGAYLFFPQVMIKYRTRAQLTIRTDDAEEEKKHIVDLMRSTVHSTCGAGGI